ncbi:MAG: glycosyltransferase [Candidatus Rokubacteria bacterium]|nr:glycosyltransferase [Candidatus Rokubacteria bacterium]
MRVGIFTNNYLPMRGGVTTAVETLRQGLEALGHRAWIFAPRFSPRPDDPPFVFRYASIPAPTYPDFPLALPFSPRLARAVRALDIEIFHAQHPFLLGATARRLARRLGRPLIFTYHTRYEKYAHYVPVRQDWVRALAIRWSCRFADLSDLVIAPSARTRDTLRERDVKAPIAVVPTGVELDRFAPGDRGAARAALGLPADDPLLLYVGRLDREKSVERLLAAFDQVAAVLPTARFLLIGGGTQARSLRDQARRSAVGDRIDFRGVRPREELPAYYRAADLFVFASESETQGLVLSEAAASALPAVAVSGCGVDEVVANSETGILTKPEPRDLADAAIALLLDPERRRRMGESARRLAERKFCARRQVGRVAALYETLSAGVKRP